MYKFGENRGIYKILEIVEYAIMHHWLRGMDAPASLFMIWGLSLYAELRAVWVL